MTKKQEEEFEEKYDETAEDYLERHGRKATKKKIKIKSLKKEEFMEIQLHISNE